MPVTINGNGSITGLAQGGIDGTKVVTSAAQPAGSVIQSVSAVSKSMPSCVKCTGEGGLAITETAIKIKEELAERKNKQQATKKA